MQIQIAIDSALDESVLATFAAVVPPLAGESTLDRAKRGIAAVITGKLIEKKRLDEQAKVSSVVNAPVTTLRNQLDQSGVVVVSVS